MVEMTQDMTPLFAPLSRPMVIQAYQELNPSSSLPVSTVLEDHVRTIAEQLGQRWNGLVQSVSEKRTQVYDLMAPDVRSSTVTSEKLAEWIARCSPKTKAPPSKDTLSRWRDMGLVRYQERNHPDTDSAAGLCLFRLLIPEKVSGSATKLAQKPELTNLEPLWYCWRQDTPTSPIIPCPVPFPDDLPKTALLWTPWIGAAWKPGWIQLGNLGAARWAGTIEDQERNLLMWDMAEEDLMVWDREIVPLGNNILNEAAPMMRHTLANLALLRLASERLKNSSLKDVHILN